MVLRWRRHEGGVRMGVRGSFFAGLVVVSVLVAGLCSAVAADAEGCPNEALRTELGSSLLPDCRAYEMVSPPYKEGYQLFLSNPGGYSSDGEQAIVYGLGVLAGTAGGGQTAFKGDLYLDRRSGSGWQLSPLNAPSSEFVGELPIAAEANSGETLWDQHTSAQSFATKELYVRSASGVFSFIGSLTPPLGEEEPSNVIQPTGSGYDRPVATTSDYGHVVLFASEPSGYWPFDLTQSFRGSLYEYSGTVSERTGTYKERPILVGVTGEKGSEHLIAVCSTRLGGAGLNGNTSTFNALSADGETVFFTVLPCGVPATAEVYARLHGSLSSPQAAETVDVSANECTVACGGESGKNFEGASEDGSRVFFTSTQKLTNDAVDGSASGDATEEAGCAGTAPGGGGCNLYAYDFSKPAGARLALISGGEVLGVLGMAEDGTRIYFASRTAIAAAGENEYSASPVAEQPNVYVSDTATGKTTFIGTLSNGDQNDWKRVFKRPVQVAGEDGRFLLFLSSRKGLTPDDETGAAQLFEYDAVTGELVRVSKGEDGFNRDGNGATSGVLGEYAETAYDSFDFKVTTNSLSVSGDGRSVFFESKDELSPRAVSAQVGCKNLYEFHTGGLISQGVVSLISDGLDTQLNKGTQCGPALQDIDETGSNVLFTTDDPLIPADVDGLQRDIYDARVDGGFPPAPAGQAGLCGPEACEGASSSAPVLPFASPSSTQAAEGNLPAPAVRPPARKVTTKKTLKCPKGKKLSHGKCVKAKGRQKQAKAKKSNRRAE